MTLPVSENTRVRTLLAILYRHYDVGGMSRGRSYESRIVEMAMTLMGGVDPDERDRIEKDTGEILQETQDHITDFEIERYQNNL